MGSRCLSPHWETETLLDGWNGRLYLAETDGNLPVRTERETWDMAEREVGKTKIPAFGVCSAGSLDVPGLHGMLSAMCYSARSL